jgi:hypothetical protein
VSRLLDAIFDPARCDDHGPEDQACLLAPRHSGWHKSNFMAWPNLAESREVWAAIGRRLRQGEMMPWLSRKEMDYALDAASRSEAADPMTTLTPTPFLR